jgi:hypothetical protein
MSDRAPALRALGYVLDPEDMWIHPRLRLLVEDVEVLLSAESEHLQGFHDPGLWEGVDPEPIPVLEEGLRRAARQAGLRWDGWLNAWDTGAGSWLRTEQLESMGPQGLLDMVKGARAFDTKHRRRRAAGCAGLFLMFGWLLVGWLAGVNAWLIGMLVIAGVTLIFRPRGMPDGLWGDADEEMLIHGLEAGQIALGEGWEEAAHALGAIPAGPDHLYLMLVERSVRTQELLERFDPEELLRILHAVSPLADDED